MGYSLDLFISEVDENLICPICHDVLEGPHTLTGCGHAFCKACLDEGFNATTASSGGTTNTGSHCCPTCRQEGEATTPAYCVQGIIDNLQIRCRNRDSEERSLTQPSASCSESSSGKSLSEEGGAIVVKKHKACSWVGKLSEWPHHARNECCVRTLCCEVDGCGFLGTAQAMQAHNTSSTVQHLKLMMAFETKRIENTLLEQLEEKLQKQLTVFEKELYNQRAYFEDLIAQERTTVVHLYLSSFCRRWMQSKPKCLSDFDVYHERKCSRMHRLLCLVPGPKGSRWKDCKFPFMLEWTSVHRPPVCRLPHELRHYYTTQTLPMYHFTKSDRWEPDVGIPELLRSIQLFLGRADVLAQSEALHRSRSTTLHQSLSLLDTYQHSQFLHNAEASFGIHPRDWQVVSLTASSTNGNNETDGMLRRWVNAASLDVGQTNHHNAPWMMM